MKAFTIVAIVLLSFSTLEIMNAVEFNYDDQSEWLTFLESQCGGDRQSPINIKTSKTRRAGKGFGPLVFKKYNCPVDGEFENMATNVEFVPNVKKATLTNKFGKYILQQFHFHWGRNKFEGSEHTVNGNQFAAEIHFVHLKEGASPSDTAGDTFSVVAVLCKAANIPVKGIWKTLSPVPTDFEEKNEVEDLVYNTLLPNNRDYYHYEGSLTTPLCNETVQWFVLQHPIEIPKAFLADLRNVERDEFGTLLTNNFRDVQPLNNRVVTKFNSDGDDDDDEDSDSD